MINLNYVFKDSKLLKSALTHRSASSIKSEDYCKINGLIDCDNQRLEFLGDAVLDLAISEYLYLFIPKLKEGEMSKIRSNLVCEPRLAEIAKKINLGEALIFGVGEKLSGGQYKNSVLADALEALLGAIYIDGGAEKTKEIIYNLWSPYLSSQQSLMDMLADYKTQLQEITQRFGLGVPKYVLTNSEGPDHEKSFTVEAWVSGNKYGEATAKSKKMAEQKAAEKAIEKIKEVEQ